MKYAHMQDDFTISTDNPMLSPVGISRKSGSWVLSVVKDSPHGLSYIREMVKRRTELNIRVTLDPNGHTETIELKVTPYEYEFELGQNQLNLIDIYLHENTD